MKTKHLSYDSQRKREREFIEFTHHNS